jgi:hypothetical protein
MWERRRAEHLEEVRRAIGRHHGPVAASHESAAVALGLPVYRHPAKAHLTRPAGSRRVGRVVVAIADLPARHVRMHRELAVTSPARTSVDIARARSFIAGLVTADAVLRTGTSRAELGDVLALMPRWPGIVSARRVVDHADALSESPLESVVRARIIELRLPLPSLQKRLYADDGWLIARVDFYWEQFGLVGEADGELKYVDERVLFREKQRRDAIEDAHHVIRWTWRQAHEPDERFRARLLAALAKAEQGRRLAG